jgi:hypothetical protein
MNLDAYAADLQAKLGPPVDGTILGWVMGQEGLVPRVGTWLEFGVAGGDSLRYLAQGRGNARLWGFDSFRGLPEDWRPGLARGHFAQERIPWVDGARLVVGLFEETLPWFSPGAVTFVHVDSDLYSSAKTILLWLAREWKCGGDESFRPIVVWDELLTGPWENGEMRAIAEAEAGAWMPYAMRYEVLAWAREDKVAMRVWFE